MRILNALFLILLFAVAVYSQTATVIAENANLRGTASQGGRIVQIVPQGTVLEVFKQTGAWFLVQAPEYTGWIHGNAIRYVSGGENGSSERTINSISTPQTVSAVRTRRPLPRVSRPQPSISRKIGATALCRDGTLSYSQSRRGTCSHHGGVAVWY